MSFRDELVTFICQDAGLSPGDFNDETELFSDGFIDSFTMASLLEFIEQSAGVEVAPEDVSLENFDTVSRIVSFVERSKVA